jgi:hypothetical protein
MAARLFDVVRFRCEIGPYPTVEFEKVVLRNAVELFGVICALKAGNRGLFSTTISPELT